MTSLGHRVRALRKERGLSQTDLAGDLVSPSYVSLIESGKRSPEHYVLDGLARRLGTTALYLESGVSPEQLTDQRLKLQFAEIALANGSVDEACQQFAALASNAGTEVRLAAVSGLARCEEARGNLHEAVTHLDDLMAASRSGQPGAPGLLTLLNDRCRVYRDAGDFNRSIEVGEEALREARALGLEGTEDEIRLASTLVGAYARRDDYFTAQHLASQVIERAERLNSPTARAAAYWNASAIAAERGQLNLALDLATKTLGFLSESSDDKSLARIRTQYAWLLMRGEPPRLDEADAMLERARVVFTGLGRQHDLAQCEAVMARAALLRGHLAEAVAIADRAIAKRAGADAHELEDAHVVKGLALALSGHVDDGAAAVAAAAGRLTQAGALLDAAKAHRELAEVLLLVGRSDEAVGALQLAADCAGARSATVKNFARLRVRN